MKHEATVLNLLCIIAALGFLAFALFNLLSSQNFLTTDNLFVSMVCLLMALIFLVNPLLYLKDEGKLPIPLLKRNELKESPQTGNALPPAAPLLDAKGRAVPPDVRSMVARMKREP